MVSTILVMGALGNVGAEVMNALRTSGQKIRAADLDARKLKQRFGASAECVPFDFTVPETYSGTFQGVDKMFMLRPPHITNVRRDMFPAIDAAKRAGVEHVVFLSLIGIDNAKFLPHYKVETYLREQGFRTTFLRCSFFMQNLNTAHRNEIRDRNELFVPVGNAKTSFVDVRDIGAVAARCLLEESHGDRNYDITGSEALDYWQVAGILSKTLQRDIKYQNPNLLHFLFETTRRGTPLARALVMTALYTSTQLGMAAHVRDDVERIIGRKPITFEQYAEQHREAWRTA